MRIIILALVLSATFPLIACGQQTAEQPLSIEVLPAPLQILTSILPAAQLSVVYTTTVLAQGGTLPYTWDISLGALPPGLLLNATTGTIAGTPTATGQFLFDLRVTDASGSATTRRFQFGRRQESKKEKIG